MPTNYSLEGNTFQAKPIPDKIDTLCDDTEQCFFLIMKLTPEEHEIYLPLVNEFIKLMLDSFMMHELYHSTTGCRLN